ncbi:hypothetical protein QVA66_05210 [Staphylococcus chromogenes]|nr:hypothetical protein [Staphylococcus chromogenes]
MMLPSVGRREALLILAAVLIDVTIGELTAQAELFLHYDVYAAPITAVAFGPWLAHFLFGSLCWAVGRLGLLARWGSAT